MELAWDPGRASYQIKSYEPGRLQLLVKSQLEIQPLPLVIMPEHLMQNWRPQTFEDLQVEDFQALMQFKPELILLGTGEKMRFLKPELFSALAQHNVGIEVMTTPAACRTYTLLMSEGRNLAAALFP